MNLSRFLWFALALCAVAAVFPVTGYAADYDKDFALYLRPGVRFGTDDRTITTFDLLVPFYQGDKNILFFNPRYSFDNRDGSEVNFGFGYRHLLFSDKVVLGANGYYDCRWTGWGTRHEQVGIGGEVMTDWVTGRMNGYFAVTDPIVGGLGKPGGTYTFRDVGIYFAGGTVEETLSGFDGELGFKVPLLSKYVETWVYAGGYHFQGDYVKDVNGFVSRLEVIPTDFLRVNFEYRNDTVNDDEYYGEVALTIPFSVDRLVKGKNPFAGMGSRIGGDRTLRERMTEPVRRDIDVQVGIEDGNAGVPGVGTKLLDVVFVSENAESIAGTPDGTFEHPFDSIGAAEGEMGTGGVYDGVTTIHVMNDGDVAGGGTASVPNLVIWGSGMPHPAYGYVQNQYLGYPSIEEVGVTGNGIEVFGGDFIDEYGIRISGSGASIHDNRFAGNIFGIYMTGGSSTITGNHFTGVRIGIYAGGGTFAINNNILGTTADPLSMFGICIGGGTPTSIDGNTIVVKSGDFQVYGIYSSGMNMTLTNNDITVTSTGNGRTAMAICMIGEDSFAPTITNNPNITAISETYSAYGIWINANSGGLGSSGSPVVISGNPHIIVHAAGPGFDTTGAAIALFAGDSIYARIENNGTAGTPVTVTGNGGSFFSPTGPYFPGMYGIVMRSRTGNVVTGDGSGYPGITTPWINNNYLSVATEHTDPFGTDGGFRDAHGMYLYAETGNVLLGMSGNTFTVNAVHGSAYGVRGYAVGDLDASLSGGTITATRTSTTDSAHGAYPLYLRPEGNLSLNIRNGAAIAAAAGPGYGRGIVGSGSNVYGTISGAVITASGATTYGIHLNAVNELGISAQPYPLDVTGTTINATGTNEAYGLNLDANYLKANINSNTATVNGGSSRYFMRVWDNNGTTGNSVDWSGNTYTPVGGPWSGNYDGGGISTTNGPVWTNFLTGITP